MISTLSLIVRPPMPLMLRCRRLLADSIGFASHSFKNNDRLGMLVCSKQSKTGQAASVENRRLAAQNKQTQLVIACLSFVIVTKFVPIAHVLVSFLLAAPRLIPKLKVLHREKKRITELIQFGITVFGFLEKMTNKKATGKNEKVKSESDTQN